MMVLPNKNKPNERQGKMDEKQYELYTAMVDAAYEYKFEGGSKQKALDACKAYAQYRGIELKKAIALSVECF
jgi:hypothetical protein